MDIESMKIERLGPLREETYFGPKFPKDNDPVNINTKIKSELYHEIYAQLNRIGVGKRIALYSVNGLIFPVAELANPESDYGRGGDIPVIPENFSPGELDTISNIIKGDEELSDKLREIDPLVLLPKMTNKIDPQFLQEISNKYLLSRYITDLWIAIGRQTSITQRPSNVPGAMLGPSTDTRGIYFSDIFSSGVIPFNYTLAQALLIANSSIISHPKRSHVGLLETDTSYFTSVLEEYAKANGFIVVGNQLQREYEGNRAHATFRYGFSLSMERELSNFALFYQVKGDCTTDTYCLVSMEQKPLEDPSFRLTIRREIGNNAGQIVLDDERNVIDTSLPEIYSELGRYEDPKIVEELRNLARHKMSYDGQIRHIANAANNNYVARLDEMF